MIEDIFLAYANNSLKNNPENFYKIIDAISRNIEIDVVGLKEAVSIICELAKFNDAEAMITLANEKGLTPIPIWRTPCTYLDALTGGRDSWYKSIHGRENDPKSMKLSEKIDKPRIFECEYREMNIKIIGEDLCEEEFTFKCYECFQLAFIQYLKKIVHGKEYSEIEDFDDILLSSSVFNEQQIVPSISKVNNRGPFKDELLVHKKYTMDYNSFAQSVYGNSHQVFNIYIFGVASFSLTEFLLQNDRRKIKICPYCSKFYIAKDIKRKNRCYSDDCRKAYQRDKKRVQRDKDPI